MSSGCGAFTMTLKVGREGRLWLTRAGWRFAE